MRLDKFLSDMGAGTRSEIKKSIRGGLVTVEGSVIKDPGHQVTADSAVSLRGTPVLYEEYVYYMLNKPAGVISASEDPREDTVVDLIPGPRRRDLFPAGRLDRDTEGLLLITNDGELAHRLLAPRHHVDKVYYAVISGTVTDSDKDAFAGGMVLSDGTECMPAGLDIISAGVSGSSEVRVTLREGKFHQIKRMFGAFGHEVIYLKRLSMGPLELDESLEPGSSRRLTQDEVESLRAL